MKKIFKTCALALAVLPMGLLTACGGGQLDFNPNIDVNSAGAYSASSMEELNEIVVGENNQTVDFSSYKMYLKMVTEDMEYDGMVIPGSEITTTAIYSLKEDGKLEMAIKSSTVMGNEKFNVEFYMPIGDYIYANVKVNTSVYNDNKNYRLPADELANVNASVSQGGEINFTEILQQIQNTFYDVTLEKAVNGDKTNFKITVDAEEEVVVYFLFENNEIVACQYNVGSMIEIKMEKYDGTINFPTFGNQYIDIEDVEDIYDFE